MSLNWNYRNVSPAGQAMIDSAWIGEGNEQSNPALDYVIWGLMGVGIATITEKNLPEVQRRFRLYQHTTETRAAVLATNDRKGVLSDAELALLVGFSTNVTTITAAAFNKRILGHVDREAQGYQTRGADNGRQGAFELCATLEVERKAKQVQA